MGGRHSLVDPLTAIISTVSTAIGSILIALGVQYLKNRRGQAADVMAHDVEMQGLAMADHQREMERLIGERKHLVTRLEKADHELGLTTQANTKLHFDNETLRAHVDRLEMEKAELLVQIAANTQEIARVRARDAEILAEALQAKLRAVEQEYPPRDPEAS